MSYIKLTAAIFVAIAASRLIPHPPNFTSLLAISFYIPAIFGRKFIPSVLLSFLLTDLILGFHSLIFFTWGSVLIIGLISKFFVWNFFYRILGALSSAVIFFIITNFGVWIIGGYEPSIKGLYTSYVMAIPFFTYSLVATIFYSLVIEFFYNIYQQKFAIK